MAQISVNDLTFYYEGSPDNISEHVSFSIDTNWKLGFVGRNGKGKTTFLNLLLGKYEYLGAINRSVVVDYFPYQAKTEDFKKTAFELIEAWKPGCEEWRVFCELDKLGVDGEVLYRSFETLSFGERTKVMLAVLFSRENDFLLIDEPTNHLDQDSREIVKKYLVGKKGFILVSHDRDLLDACINHVLVLNRKMIEVQAGNFSSWWENKNRKDAFVRRENEKHKKEIRKLKAASERTREWADKSERTKIGFDPIKEHERNISTRAYIGAKTKKMQSRVKQMEYRIGREIEEKEGLLQDLEKISDLKISPINEGSNGIFRSISVDDKIVGNISVERKDDVFCKDAEIGYFLLTEYWSKGIMTEAVRQICQIAFDELDILRITGLVYNPNNASKKVLEKNGFAMEGTMKQAVVKDGSIYDLCILGKLR